VKGKKILNVHSMEIRIVTFYVLLFTFHGLRERWLVGPVSRILLEIGSGTGSLCEDSVRHVACVHCSAEGQGENIAGAGFAERFGTLVDGCAGCEDIVDQEDVFAGDRLRTRYGKRVAEIIQPLFSRERGLRRCWTCPDQIGAGYGNIEMPADLVGKKQGLIEFPLPQTSDVERDGDDQVDGFQWGKAIDHQPGKWHRQRDLPAVFKQVDGVLEGRQIGVESPSLGVGGRMVPA